MQYTCELDIFSGWQMVIYDQNNEPKVVFPINQHSINPTTSDIKDAEKLIQEGHGTYYKYIEAEYPVHLHKKFLDFSGFSESQLLAMKKHQEAKNYLKTKCSKVVDDVKENRISEIPKRRFTFDPKRKPKNKYPLIHSVRTGLWNEFL